MSGSGCCAPRRDGGAARAGSRSRAILEAQTSAPAAAAAASASARIISEAAGSSLGETTADMVVIPAGEFNMGCSRREGPPADGESPQRRVKLDEFRIDRCAVSNQRFARFVQATGYRTDAERVGWSFVFAGLLPDDFADTAGVAAAPWWRQVFGADWAHPEGPQSHLIQRDQHPVVHISHADALAFCAWAGKRLPSEAEWEKAARGGLEGQRFAWGDEEMPDGLPHCNVWQGVFPNRNDRTDGYYGLAPVDAFPANGYGLYNMAGNCWEWCADWYDGHWHRNQWRAAAGAALHNPLGPPDGVHRVMRGGSYLCHPSYCWRYRNAARSGSVPDSSTGHIGFRCAL